MVILFQNWLEVFKYSILSIAGLRTQALSWCLVFTRSTPIQLYAACEHRGPDQEISTFTRVVSVLLCEFTQRWRECRPLDNPDGQRMGFVRARRRADYHAEARHGVVEQGGPESNRAPPVPLQNQACDQALRHNWRSPIQRLHGPALWPPQRREEYPARPSGA